jgi:midasin (ATPase involved in ribosome maturation)
LFAQKNASYFDSVVMSFEKADWRAFLNGLKSSIKLVENKIGNVVEKEEHEKAQHSGALQPELRVQWKQLAAAVAKFEIQQDKVKNKFAFAFVEGCNLSSLKVTFARSTRVCCEARRLDIAG